MSRTAGTTLPKRQPSAKSVVAMLFLTCMPWGSASQANAWLQLIVHPVDSFIGTLPLLECPARSGNFPIRALEEPILGPLVMPGTGTVIGHAAVSNDGSSIALGTEEGAVIVVRAQTGEIIAKESLDAYGEQATAPTGQLSRSPILDFSPDSRWLMVAPPWKLGGDERKPIRAFLLDLAMRKRYNLEAWVSDWGFSPRSDTLAYMRSFADFHDETLNYRLLKLGSQNPRTVDIPLSKGLRITSNAWGLGTRGGIRPMGGDRVVVRLTRIEENGDESNQVFAAFDIAKASFLDAQAFDVAAFTPRPADISIAKSILPLLAKSGTALPFSRCDASISGPAGPPPAANDQPTLLPVKGSPQKASVMLSQDCLLPLAIRQIGGRLITVLSVGKGSEYPRLRIRVEDESGHVIADKRLDGVDCDSEPEAAVIRDDGTISVIYPYDETSKNSATLEISADLATCMAWYVPCDSQGSELMTDGSFMGRYPGGYHGPDGSLVAYNASNHEARVFSIRASETARPDQIHPLAVTPHYVIIGVDNIPVKGGEAGGIEVFRHDGRFVAGIVLRTGQGWVETYDPKCVWEKPDRSLVLLSSYSPMLQGSGVMSRPAILSLELGPVLRLASRLIQFPDAYMPTLRSNETYVTIGRDGACLAIKHSSPYTFARLFVRYRSDAAGLPDPQQGLANAWLFDDPSFFSHFSRPAWTILQRGDNYRLAGFFDYPSNGIFVASARGFEIPLCAGPANPEVAPRPELVLRPWVNMESRTLPLASEKGRLVDVDEEAPSFFYYAFPVSCERTGSGEDVALLNDSAVRIRAQEGTSGAILGKLAQGQMVLILERGSRKDTIDGTTAPWYRVRTAYGLEGWVFSAFLDQRKLP